MRLRAEYKIGSPLRFLATLDMMNLMARALRRAKIPYALSAGFNPHIRMSMGTVLPVGLWGEKEYFDLELTQPIPPQVFRERMNLVLPEAMRINHCCVINPASPALMKVINAAVYTFVIEPGLINLADWAQNIMRQDTLPVKSRGKKKDVDKDLKIGLYKIETQGEVQINLWVSSGESFNIRYDEVQALLIKQGLPEQSIQEVYRQGNYIKQGDKFYTPLEKVN